MTLSHERELRSATVPTGQRRTLSVEIRDEAPPRLTFIEKYSGEGTGWLGRFTSFRAEAALDADPEPLVQAVAALADAGKLDLPPMGARERVADLLAAAGLIVRRQSTVPWAHLGRRATLAVSPDGRSPSVTFSQYAGDEGRFQVTTPYDGLDRIASHLATLSTVDGPAGDRLGRFFAAFEAFAAEDVGAERVHEMFVAAGVESQRREERRYPLLKVHRENTDCIFTLSLLVSSIDDKISFSEFYDYMPRSGDSGREYGYSAVTPYDSLGPLTALLESRLGVAPDGALPDRLAACLREFVARGALGDGRPIEACRDQVALWYAEAGVPYRPDHWVWFNSD
ncbi:MAG TPA: hypothetical protein VL738_01270 [Dactylosporangium sp.]|nr:hypothetical protein [Dactylosporangium sp.]